MAESTDEIQKLADKLKTQRDELKVRLKLGEAEAKQQWEKLEHQWSQVEGKLRTLGKEAGQVGTEVRTSAKQLLKTIQDGYEKLRRSV